MQAVVGAKAYQLSRDSLPVSVLDYTHTDCQIRMLISNEPAISTEHDVEA
jgi:hypothetical protein